VAISPEALRRLSVLLDTALDLPESERATWLSNLAGDDAALAPTLHDLLVRQASRETADLLERPPAFTVAGVEPAASELHEGNTVGAYRLERLLGSGGMGEVWLAERIDGSLKRKVALKLPHVGWAPGLAERFAREREILSGLEHPNIARLYDAGVDQQGRPYMALEYVDGQPLDEYCNSRALSIDARLKHSRTAGSSFTEISNPATCWSRPTAR
jgi:serine/threonine-protein kinase